MSTIWSFDHIETKHTLYREKDYIKTLCKKRLYKNFKRTAINIIDFEKKMLLLTEVELKVTLRCKSMLYLWKKNLKKII